LKSNDDFLEIEKPIFYLSFAILWITEVDKDGPSVLGITKLPLISIKWWGGGSRIVRNVKLPVITTISWLRKKLSYLLFNDHLTFLFTLSVAYNIYYLLKSGI